MDGQPPIVTAAVEAAWVGVWPQRHSRPLLGTVGFSRRWGMADAADAATDRLVLSSGPWPTVSTVADRSITTPLACREGRRFTTPI